MTEQTSSQTKNLRKKLQKREQRILGRLQGAQKAQARALERFHRDEVRLQKRISSVLRIEGRLTLVRQQLDELNASPAVSPVETDIPAWAQSNAPSDEPGSITEPTDLATEARAAAEAAEENSRLATARAAEISETARTETVE